MNSNEKPNSQQPFIVQVENTAGLFSESRSLRARLKNRFSG
jgi:hypothetical protein